jgi:hypothetical protein
MSSSISHPPKCPGIKKRDGGLLFGTKWERMSELGGQWPSDHQDRDEKSKPDQKRSENGVAI